MIELDDVFVLHPVLDRQVAALRGLSLTVATGERVVINGPSGSGKSTLVQLVTGRLRPNAGTAMVLDHDLGSASQRAIMALQRNGLGIVTQQMVANLAPELSGLGNVALQSRLSGRSRQASRTAATAMLSRLGVEHLADRPLGTISAGEAQRVALAAALAHRPAVIVADEPTGALDAANAAIVFDLLAELSDELGAAMLVVSHDPAAGRIGHRVLEIRDGRLGVEHLTDGSDPRLVVDRRGWLRLPEAARRRSGIVDRAVLDRESSDAAETGHGGSPVVALRRPDGSESFATLNAAQSTPVDHSSGREVAVLHGATRHIGDVVVLAATELHVSTGELVVVAGRSGSGKTTLLALLGSFAQPTAGEVRRADGVRVAVGIANPGFAETLSLRDNIRLSITVRGIALDSDREAMIDEQLRAVGLLELAERPVCTLSGGERQRACIVRALTGDADLVLLDEPTSQLDQGLAHRVAMLLVEHARAGHAVVCASHEPELIAAADRVHSLS